MVLTLIAEAGLSSWGILSPHISRTLAGIAPICVQVLEHCLQNLGHPLHSFAFVKIFRDNENCRFTALSRLTVHALDIFWCALDQSHEHFAFVFWLGKIDDVAIFLVAVVSC